MNKGIDKKGTYKEIDVKGAGIIRINLSKTLGGVFFDVPIYNTKEMEYKLIGSSFNILEEGKINFTDSLTKEFKETNSKIIVIDGYGKETSYELEETGNYYDAISKTTIEIKQNKISIKDKYDNEIKYKQTYNTKVRPIKMTYKGKTVIDNEGETEEGVVYKDYGKEKIKTNKIDENKEEIIFSKEESPVYKVEILKETNNKIQHKHYRYIEGKYEYLYSTEYIMEETYIKVIDHRSGYSVKIVGSYTSDKTFYPTNIYYSIESNNTSTIIKEEAVMYSNNYTSVTEVKEGKNKTIDYHFENELLKKIVDYKGRVKLYEYDERKNLISESKWYYNDYERSNINSITCNYESNEFEDIRGSNTEIVSDMTQYARYYGSSLLKIKPGIIEKEFNKTNFRDSFLTIKLWARKVQGTKPLKIKIKLQNDSTVVNEKEIEIKDINFELYIEEIKASEYYNKIKLEIMLEENSIYHITGLCLYDTYSKVHYYYDEEDNLIKSTSNKSEIDYSYEKYLKETKTNNSYISYKYNNKGYITNKIMPYGVLLKSEYDEDNQKIREELGYNKKYNEEKYEYTNGFLTKKINNEDTSTIYTYDEKRKVITKEEIEKEEKKIETEYKYNKYNELEQRKQNVEVIEYDYHDKEKRYDTIKCMTRNSYKYYYNEKDQLIKISYNQGTLEKVLVEYEYEDDKIKKIKKYNKEYREYEYTDDKLTKIIKKDGRIIEYRYDTQDKIIGSYSGTEEIKYEYDKEDRLIKVEEGKLSNKYQYNDKEEIVQRKEKVDNEEKTYLYERSKIVNIEDIYGKYYSEDIGMYYCDDPYHNGESNIPRMYYKKNQIIMYKTGRLYGKAKVETSNKVHYIDLRDSNIYTRANFDLTNIGGSESNNNYLNVGLWAIITSESKGILMDLVHDTTGHIQYKNNTKYG